MAKYLSFAILSASVILLSLNASFNSPPKNPPQLSSSKITNAQAKARIDVLRNEIAYHNDLYFNKNAPVITDAQYDQLKSELNDLEKQFPALIATEDNIWDDATSDFPSHTHLAPMLSLDKAYNQKEFEHFQQSAKKALQQPELDYIIEPKYDGLAISATYIDGVLSAVTTRGNGLKGNDLYRNVIKHPSFPTSLNPDTSTPIPHHLEIRGEAFLSNQAFESINQQRSDAGQAIHQSPRNLAAGIIRRKEPSIEEINALSFVFFSVQSSARLKGIQSQSDLYDLIAAWGLTPIQPFLVAHGNVRWSEISNLLENIKSLSFPCDGLVVKLLNRNAQKKLGQNATTPRWAIACKPSPASRLTTLQRVDWQVGRTGRLTPVAIFDPITVSNASIQRASLNNLAQIKKLDLHQGDTIRVQRAGEVIPVVTTAITEYRDPHAIPISAPSLCPSCHQPTTTNPNGTLTQCQNLHCHDRIKAQTLHFADCLMIKGFGPESADALISQKIIQMPSDLLRITDEFLLNEKYATIPFPIQLAQSINKAKSRHAIPYIIALGIPSIGKKTAYSIFDQIKTLNDLPDVDHPAIQAYFQHPFNRENFNQLIELTTPNYTPNYHPTPLADIHFVITGVIESPSNDLVIQKINQLGGTIDSRINNQTNFLIVGKQPGESYWSAKALGIPLIDQSDLNELLNNPESFKSR